MSSLFDAVSEGTRILCEHNIDNAAGDSYTLLSEVCGFDRTYYLMHNCDQIDETLYNTFMNMINKRASHVPLQHITGHSWFYGYDFNVNSDVLVPRPDTEVLVENALKVVPDNGQVLDMCTGSGCIIITIALEKHIKKGIGVDLSEAALKVAESNRIKLAAENVDLINSDLFDKLEGYVNTFDVLVSNPPYIRTSVIETLTEEVKLHDPMMALDGYENGLFFYEKITDNAGKYLKNGGWLMYEIGYDQGEEVSELMKNAGYSDIEIIKDLAGLDRVVKGRLRL